MRKIYNLISHRYCYTSLLLPKMADRVREHWRTKTSNEEEEDIFWEALGMTGFEAWLQGDRLIHCLEGASLDGIFSGLQQQIEKKNSIALRLQNFYKEVLGKDYSHPSTKPNIECLTDLQLSGRKTVEKRGALLSPKTR